MDPVAVDLTMLADYLEAQAAESPNGRHLQPVALDHEHLRMTGIGLTAGSELPPHDNPGEAVLQVLRGQVRLVSLGADGTEARALDLAAGFLGRIPDGRHRVEALEPSALLLTALPLPLRG
ncbi:LuxR family transcriptional regulator [Microcella frigidaquae]|uniref:Quercetin dioxygenase-like cupin family protein n=1 Tax=Microcella frigidaquae TaxID=424758 RepID=A0A840XHU1_9MICO|nr:LuxR family transcriptional regulator [Microcella frigidaquae]MBB5617886.1 quercetin dioxygenase-like cupin family protein [Microcella frigidaquae]NHN44400.1 LuxR family transcriptional regulator [Microcella frigidaquae]